MSDHAGILCHAKDVKRAHHDARALNQSLGKNGLSLTRNSEAGRVIQWQQMAVASEAVLAALDFYITQGGGSRGARAICDPDGTCLPEARTGLLPDVRFRPERDDDMQSQILVRLVNKDMVITTRPNRSFDPTAKSVFERDWPAWLTGSIFDLADNSDTPC